MLPVPLHPASQSEARPARRGAAGWGRQTFILLSLVLMTGLGAEAHDSPALWEPAAGIPWGLAGFGRGVVAGKLLVAGGTAWDGNTKLLPETVWQYDPGNDRWTEAGRLSRPFAFGISFAHHTGLFLLGGDDGRQTRADGMVLAVGGANRPSPALPRPVAYAGFVAAPDGKVFVLGGTSTMSDLAHTHASFYRFNPANGRSEVLPDFPGGPVIHAALALVDGYVYAFSGGLRSAGEGTTRNSSAAWRYRIDGGQWESIAPYPVGIRGLAAKALDARFILLAGGLKSTPDGRTEFTGDCHLYDTQRCAYIPLPALPHAAMLVGLEVLEGDLYVFGGEDRPRHRSARVFRAPVSRLIALGLAAAAPPPLL